MGEGTSRAPAAYNACVSAWIESNKDVLAVVLTAFGVLVALGGVAVAAFYAYLTRGLLRATKQQADITQRVFEASHRPFLLITAPAPTRLSGDLHWDFRLENKGPVPAILTAWQLTVRFEGHEIASQAVADTGVTFAVFPGATEAMEPLHIGNDLTKPASGTSKPMDLEAVVRYRGVGPTLYMTRTVYRYTMGPYNTLWERRELLLD